MLAGFLRAYFSLCLDVDEGDERGEHAGAGALDRPVASIRVVTGAAPLPADRFRDVEPRDVDRSKGFLRTTARLLDRGEERWALLAPSGATIRS